MSAIVLDGKQLAKQVEVDLRKRAERLGKEYGRAPVLATICVGENPVPKRHLALKGRACERIGVQWRPVELASGTSTAELLDVIHRLNRDESVSGVLLQMPLPPAIDSRACCDAIAPGKDVDGLGSYSFARRTCGGESFGRATPLGIMRLLAHHEVRLAGCHAVVAGVGTLLCTPMAMLLLQADATVSVVAPNHAAFESLIRQADLIVASVGKPEFVKAEWIPSQAVVIDAGYNAGNVGDVEMAPLPDRVAAYTPVPGGVYPMTIATLIEQVITAAERGAAASACS